MKKVIFTEEGHKYHDETGKEYPSVSSILEHFGISNMEMVRRIHGDEYMDYTAKAGTEIHRITKLDDLGQLKRGDWNPEFTPWLNAWRQYKEQYKPVFMAIEQPLISEVWGFAGTPDRIEDWGKWAEIGDLKSGVRTRAQAYQTALYQVLVEENYKVKVKKRKCIHLKKDEYKLYPYEDKGIINDVKCLLRTYNIQKSMGVIK